MALPNKDADREFQKFAEVSGNVTVRVSNSDGTILAAGGTSMVDDAAFTPAASSVTPMGALADETATDSVDEGDIGAPRMTTDRKLLVRVVGATDGNRLDVDASGMAQMDIAATSVTVPASVADGSDVAEGATTDAAATAGGTGTLSAKLRALSRDLVSNIVLAAGTNAIGKLAANSGVDIGDIDVTSVIPGTGGTNLGKAEDAAHTTGDTGVQLLAVRKATPANVSDTDGDYEPLQISAGRLWASATIDAALPAGTNAIGKLAANSGVDIGDVDVTSQVAATFDHGSNRDIDTVAEQITTASVATKFGVTVRADPANTGTVYLGNSDVTAGTTDATDGFPLRAGESILLPVNNANLIYAIGSAVNQIVYWIAV